MPIGIYWPAPVLQEQKKYAKFLCISMTSEPLKRRRILGTETKTIGKNEIAINASFVFCQITTFYGEFDPGSGRTLAACLTHASRTMKFLRGWISGERVRNT